MKYIVFKRDRLSRTKIKNNILRMWEQTSEDERFDWYKDAYEYAFDLSLSNNVSINKVCGIIAALSPVKTWKDNKKIAKDLIETRDCGHMQLFKDKALAILDCDGDDESILDILSGRKISSFYLNIRYPDKANNVTIDRHALSIAVGEWVTDDYYRGMTAKQYEFFSQCYALAGAKVGVSTLLMQSATWVKFRKIKEQYK